MAYVMGGDGQGYTPNLDDGELWLPSDFLSNKTDPKMAVQNSGPADRQFFPYEWGPSADSTVSSPVESAVGFSETDEEDDYMAGLAQRVAYAMLEDDDDDENCGRNVGVRGVQWVPEQTVFVEHGPRKGSCAMARSPQSTLTGLESWSTGGLSSHLPSPLSNNTKEDAWVLFNMTADQVVRLNMAGFEHEGLVRRNKADEVPHSKSLLAAAAGETRAPQYLSGVQRNHSTVTSSAVRKEYRYRAAALCGIDSAYNGSHQGPLQRTWNPRPKAEDHKIGTPVNLAKQCSDTVGSGRQQTRAGPVPVQGRCGSGNRVINRPSHAFAPGHVGGGSGMRAVFLGSNGPGRESGGTGVFLPRRMDNGYTAKSKPACSTVLLPARIVQALNLNVEDLRSQPCGLSDSTLNRHDHARKVERRQSFGGDSWPEQQQQQQQQKAGFYSGFYETQPPSSELSLPQEWTY